MTETTAICRFCHATCGLRVTIEDGRVVHAIGDIDNPMYHGYSCVKGRNFHEFHADPRRVLRPLQRDATGCRGSALPFDGSFVAPGVGRAGDERLDSDSDDQRIAPEPSAIRHGWAARCKFNFRAWSGVSGV